MPRLAEGTRSGQPRAGPGLLNWPVALELGRVSNLPTVWTNVLAGIVLSGGGGAPGLIVLLLASLTLLYTGGMFLNDAFDREIDARERPGRPIPSGRISAAAVFSWGFGMLGGGVLLLLAAGYTITDSAEWRPAAAGLALAGAIVLYDAWHKGNPVSPLIMGLCRMLVYVTAGYAVASALPAPLFLGAGVLLCYLIGLTFAAKQENLNRITNLWPLLFLAVPFVYAPAVPGLDGAGMAIYAGFAAWVLYALSFLVVPSRINVPRAVVSLLAGICLLDALLISASGGQTLAWLAVAGFPLTLFLQRWVSGT
ncbi:MAG: UbiA family prenyltransferase [Proteobacteria bacterium]|nr:UbiA family prenyltransferase [Pseudomonadota bacterium]